MRTQVAIVGAGPAGMLLSHLLDQHGVESIVVETRSEDYVASRIRAGVLEHSTVELLDSVGLGDRLKAEGDQHRGIHLQWPGERHHIDFVDLTDRSVWVYGQTEVQRDLVAARAAAGQEIHYEITDTTVHDVESERPSVTFVDAAGTPQRIDADVVVGCDGSFGPSRSEIPEGVRKTWERVYPYSWLGILADVAPSTDELIYAWHPDGFAMHSMRSPTVSRLYLQVPNGTDVGTWSDDRIWDALATRLGHGQDGWRLEPGPVTEKSVLPMR
ncbi:MAG: 4-hydroxybenzoate 3-monooxygenase, partial [Aeromicrobium sp.]